MSLGYMSRPHLERRLNEHSQKVRIFSQHIIRASADKHRRRLIRERRSNYYNYYTGQKWGRLENFDLTVDSSKLGIDGTAEFIAQFVGDYRKQKGV